MRQESTGKPDPERARASEPAQKRGFFAAAGARLKRVIGGRSEPEPAVTAAPAAVPTEQNADAAVEGEVSTSVQARARELLLQDRHGLGRSRAAAAPEESNNETPRARRTSPPPLPSQRTAADPEALDGVTEPLITGVTAIPPERAARAAAKRPVRDSKSEALRARLGAAKAALAEAQAKRAADSVVTTLPTAEDAEASPTAAAADELQLAAADASEPAQPSAADDTAPAQPAAAAEASELAQPPAATNPSAATSAAAQAAQPSAAANTATQPADAAGAPPALPSAADSTALASAQPSAAANTATQTSALPADGAVAPPAIPSTDSAVAPPPIPSTDSAAAPPALPSAASTATQRSAAAKAAKRSSAPPALPSAAAQPSAVIAPEPVVLPTAAALRAGRRAMRQASSAQAASLEKSELVELQPDHDTLDVDANAALIEADLDDPDNDAVIELHFEPADEAEGAQPTAAQAEAVLAASSGKTEAAADPIRTLTIARLLARQGYFDRSLSIYDELLANGTTDPKLRAEADKVRAKKRKKGG